MSTDKVNTIPQLGKDITWKMLITDAQKAIKTHQETIARLQKSIVFFTQQDATGVAFPVLGKEEVKRHEDCS
jgi:hypothetical protein